MIRRVQFKIYPNQGKVEKLDLIMDESIKMINFMIDQIWNQSGSKTKLKYIDHHLYKDKTWLSARLIQCLGKQALEIVKSQRKKRKQTKPIFNRPVINLDQRLIDIKFDLNSFDTWFKLFCIGNKIQIKLPSRKHKHFHELIGRGFILKKSARLRKSDSGYFIDLYLEKEDPEPKSSGKVVGYDIGYKKLLIDNEGTKYDQGLEPIYEKISRKKQGSKGFKRALVERNNLINQSLNIINLDGVKEVVVENLKNVKKGSKGKIRKKFNNKLQRWSYPKVLNKLSNLCEEAGTTFTKVNPAYTSQTCSCCGFKDRKNRVGESFRCLNCGVFLDADHNAAINISHMGVYSLHTLEQVP